MPPFLCHPPKIPEFLCHPVLCHPWYFLCHHFYATPQFWNLYATLFYATLNISVFQRKNWNSARYIYILSRFFYSLSFFLCHPFLCHPQENWNLYATPFLCHPQNPYATLFMPPRGWHKKKGGWHKKKNQWLGASKWQFLPPPPPPASVHPNTRPTTNPSLFIYWYIWVHLVHLGTFKYIWVHLSTFGYIWVHLGTFGYI